MTTADASPGHSVRLALLEHAVLRVSFWPIETLDPFAASGLLEASRQLSVEEARAAERRQAVIDAIERSHAEKTWVAIAVQGGAGA